MALTGWPCLSSLSLETDLELHATARVSTELLAGRVLGPGMFVAAKLTATYSPEAGGLAGHIALINSVHADLAHDMSGMSQR